MTKYNFGQIANKKFGPEALLQDFHTNFHKN